MRKLLFIVCVIVIFLGLLRIGIYVRQNIGGSRPAFGSIPKLPAQPSQHNAAKGAVNTTGLPLVIPNGFSVSTLAEDLEGARALAWDPSGALLVSLPSQGKVVSLTDSDADGDADNSITVMSDLNLPHGIAFKNGKLYIAETNQVAVYAYDAKTKRATNKKKIIDLPSGGNHFSRTIGFGPDGSLYISIGSSCNVCVEKDLRRAKILIANDDGTNLRDYASGLRNSVFFTWHPATREMWATDMGRDLLGDNYPPEEVNIVKNDGFYGWPYCYNNKIHDRSFDASDNARSRCDDSIAPHITFQAHSAPLGLAFIPDNWPEEYRGDLLVSYHGSWNRSQPTGYKVARFDLKDGQWPIGESDFLHGWLVGDGALGRPVDLLFDQTGALYVSDDKAGVVYVVSVIQK